jgi:hypothetical protein
MVCAAASRRPHVAVPAFWSSQFGVNIKSVGVPSAAEEVAITQGSLEEASQGPSTAPSSATSRSSAPSPCEFRKPRSLAITSASARWAAGRALRPPIFRRPSISPTPRSKRRNAASNWIHIPVLPYVSPPPLEIADPVLTAEYHHPMVKTEARLLPEAPKKENPAAGGRVGFS